MCTMETVYKVPVIAADLSHEETILQVADVLAHLSKITDDVFGSIERRIQENGDHLQQLNSRIRLAQKKVDTLKQSQKATQVFSSSKYPAKPYEEYKSIFVETKPSEIHRTSKSVKTKKQSFDPRDLQEKLHFYHVRRSAPSPSNSRLDDYEPKSIPAAAASATSFLVFNTTENPCQKFESVNPLEKRIKTRRNEDVADTAGLSEAPASMTAMEEQEQVDNYFYNPELGEIPELDLPDILDLPNIAQDFNFASDLGPGIAPSFGRAEVDLFGGGTMDLGGGDLGGGAFDITDAPPLDLTPQPPKAPIAPTPIPAPSTAPPPPPPSSAPLPLTAAPMTAAPMAAAPMTAAPMTADPEDPEDPDEEPETAKVDVPDGIDSGGRSSLMEAIRNAGGSGKAGLKSVKERKAEERKAKEEEKMAATKSGGGDLLSDLAQKLSMRRKGISGRQQTDAPPPPALGTMDKISLMIPPPTNAGSTLLNDVEGSDDDWD